jgi:membrane-bound serine protease (ClpP class)
VKSVKMVRMAMGPLSFLAIAGGLTGMTQAQERHVLLVQINGIINPVVERFIARAVERAEVEEAELLVIQLDTPGGLLSSTRKITQHLLEADVPTVVYVAPRGSRAASAGTFITASANFAVMAPGSNIGAASPVGGSGEDLPDTLKSKVFSDAAAEMRSIAELRGRNQEKLAATVLESLSFSAEEAVDFNVVDFTAGDIEDLLAQVNGRQAVLLPPDGPIRVMNTLGLTVRDMEMSIVERFLRFLSDPNISFLLLSLGGLGLWIELVNPGLVLPGVAGAILLVLAFVALGNLPVNWAGVVLILLALALAVLEFYVSGFGALGVGAMVSLVLGGLFLFFHTGVPSATMPPISVSFWVLGPTAAVLGGAGVLTGWAIVQSRKGPPEPGVDGLVGETGEATSDLAPRGTVRLRNESWTAVVEGGAYISTGETVRVVKADDITLTVARLDEVSEPVPEASGS